MMAANRVVWATPGRLDLAVENWPISGSFRIARGAKTEATVVVATISAEGAAGRGECVPYARYGDTVDRTMESLRGAAKAVDRGLSRETLRASMPPGAARNALDCALWDLEARLTGRPVVDLAGIGALRPVETAFTLSLDSAENMAAAARAAADRPILKIKLGADGDGERLVAVREAAPRAQLIVDANEGWTEANLAANLDACAAAGVALVEQPLPADRDAVLATIDHRVPLCADESLHVGDDLDRISGRYDAVNIKLDKTGGLTEALELMAEAKRRGLVVMVGCMVATSLAMAPAMLLAQQAEFVDLDGPLLLARDREPGLVYRGSLVMPPPPGLWG